MNRKRKYSTWKRTASRLVRRPVLVLEESTNHTRSDEPEMQVFRISDADKHVAHEKMMKIVVVQEHIKSKYAVIRTKVDQHCPFLKRLPQEILVMVLDELSPVDIKSITETCKYLKEFVNRNYVESLILPLSPKNLKRIGGRAALRIISSFKLDYFPDRDFYMSMLNQINIHKLKILRFNGNQFKYYIDNGCSYQQHFNRIRVSLHYIEILDYYLTNAPRLQVLDILVDRSEEMADIIKYISANLPHLKDLTLRDTHYTCDDYPPPFSRSISESHGNYTGIYNSDHNWDLNSLIAKVLENESIQSLTLKGVGCGWSWLSDYQNHVHQSLYWLKIESKNLQRLVIRSSKSCQMDSIMCPNLTEFEFQEFPCLCAPRGLFNNEPAHHLAVKLSRGCPKLERFNSRNIKLFREDFNENHLEDVLCIPRNGVPLSCQLCDDRYLVKMRDFKFY